MFFKYARIIASFYYFIFKVDHGLTVNENLEPGHYYLLNMICCIYD